MVFCVCWLGLEKVFMDHGVCWTPLCCFPYTQSHNIFGTHLPAGGLPVFVFPVFPTNCARPVMYCLRLAAPCCFSSWWVHCLGAVDLKLPTIFTVSNKVHQQDSAITLSIDFLSCLVLGYRAEISWSLLLKSPWAWLTLYDVWALINVMHAPGSMYF